MNINFAHMKKSTIWIITIIMGLSFVGLLYLQVSYIETVATLRREQFNESVVRSLDQASRNLEQNETLVYLQSLADRTREQESDSVVVSANGQEMQQSRKYQLTGMNGTLTSTLELKTVMKAGANTPFTLKSPGSTSISDATQSLQDFVKRAYVYQRAVLDEVVYNILYTASDKPLKDRINFKQLDLDLRSELQNNGIDLPYHFVVTTGDGREVYRCLDYEEEGEAYAYNQILFRNDPGSKLGVLRVHFPDMKRYLFSSVRFMIPSLIFTGVLLVTFIFTIYIVFRQKKLSEIKNDFVNNMTHELKTPISSISLAAQMLNDPAVNKSPQIMEHVSKVITDESKRLRFQVEKVLQMSMFEHDRGTLKKSEVDVNDLIENVVNTFSLKVHNFGGSIDMDLKAVNAKVYADDMHLTNVIFNLMDNAVKYRQEDRELRLKVTTWNHHKGTLCIGIEDNGIGIKKDDLKKIFEKFYRVHTGNRHDVKGFGIGLAYVKKIVEMHKGYIEAESELGRGTKFVITLPILNS
jgi:two-component system phosphate regulon sensor histidine kinase PhoR